MNASRNETCALEAGKMEELQYTLSRNEQRRVCFTTLGVRAEKARETPENVRKKSNSRYQGGYAQTPPNPNCHGKPATDSINNTAFSNASSSNSADGNELSVDDRTNCPCGWSDAHTLGTGRIAGLYVWFAHAWPDLLAV